MGHWEQLPAKSNPAPALPLYCLGRNSAAEGKNRALFTHFSAPPARVLSFSPRTWSPRHVSGRCPVGAFMAGRLLGRALGCPPRVSLESRSLESFGSVIERGLAGSACLEAARPLLWRLHPVTASRSRPCEGLSRLKGRASSSEAVKEPLSRATVCGETARSSLNFRG